MLIMNLSSTNNSFRPEIFNLYREWELHAQVDRFSHSHPPPTKAKDATCSIWDAMRSESALPTFSHFLSIDKQRL